MTPDLIKSTGHDLIDRFSKCVINLKLLSLIPKYTIAGRPGRKFKRYFPLKTPAIMSRPVSVSYHTNMGIRTALFTLNRPLEEGLARLARGHSVVETWEDENGLRLPGHSSF